MSRKSFMVVFNDDLNIGNFSENLHYTLFKAERLNKKVKLIRKRMFFEKFLKKVFNRKQLTGVYRLHGALIDSHYTLIDRALELFYGFYFWSNLISRAILWKLKILRKLELKTISRGETDIFNIENKGIFDVGSMGAVNWSSLLEKKQDLFFCSKDEKKCQENLRQLGVGEGQWYVCLHIRTSFYHSSYMDEHRNSSVENYLEAINYIHSLGGVVIRLGDPVFLGYEDAYIDYPNTSFKSELMDLFLIKNCRFFWGTNSGIFDTALLFGVPTLAVNVSDFLFIRPYKSADRIIYKPILSREEGKIMSFEEVFRHTDSIMMSNIGLSGFEAFDKDYKMVENTSDEIRQVIEEMCVGFENDLPETYFQQAFKAQLNIAAIRWATQKFSDRHLNNAYRIAAKTYFSGRIGRHFAEKYLYGTPDLPHDKERCYEAEQ